MQAPQWRATALLLGAGVLLAACDSGPERFGKTLESSTRVPAETMAEFAALVATARDPRLSTLENLASAKGVSWSAPVIDVTTRASPYRLAIRVKASAPAEGPATSLWIAGWGKLDQDGQPQDVRASAVGNIGDGDLKPDKLKASRTLERAGASAPVTFKEDGKVLPVIELKKLANMTLEQVDVEVWSGIDSPNWREIVFGWQSALVGLVMLVLWFRWFRRSGST